MLRISAGKKNIASTPPSRRVIFSGDTGGSDQLYDIALEIEDVVIRDEAAAAVGGVVQRKRSAGFVVEEVQNFRDTAVYLSR